MLLQFLHVVHFWTDCSQEDSEGEGSEEDATERESAAPASGGEPGLKDDLDAEVLVSSPLSWQNCCPILILHNSGYIIHSAARTIVLAVCWKSQ